MLRTVEQHMLADVPVGAFLPGCVDSGVVTAAMTRATRHRIKALRIGFPQSAIDETAAARRVAEHLGCEPIVLPMHPVAAAQPWLPAGALDRRKRGFQLPFAEWFRGDFSDFARDAWHSSGADRSGYLEARKVEAIGDEHRAGQANHGR